MAGQCDDCGWRRSWSSAGRSNPRSCRCCPARLIPASSASPPNSRFIRQHARFPNAEADIAPAVIAYLAEQIGVPAAALAGYDWVGRSGRRQRQTILDFLPSGRSTRRRGHVPPLACDRGAAARAEPCSFGGGDRRVVRPRPCRADRRLSP